MQEESRAGLQTPGTEKSAAPPEDYVFALDIGTRSVIGIVGLPQGERLQVCAVEIAEHEKRAMVDGQIEDIEQVAHVAGLVKARLEQRVGCSLHRVCVAAAGRALRTREVHFELDLQSQQVITPEILCRLEAGAVQQAEQEFAPEAEDGTRSVFYLVGYSVSRYVLDNYPMATLLEHRGQLLEADVIATFLPREVVDSLYAAMQKCGLEVASLTLEPIAAINAAIPQSLRLLNLALVDIGAGTSDIAVSRDGGVVGYTMATIAGDEITEALMREYLVDFSTAEAIKLQLGQDGDLVFTDILGLEQQMPAQRLREKIAPVQRRLAEEISQQILKANGTAPSAVFLVGGGSKLPGLCADVAELLGLPAARVALGGRNFSACLTEPNPALTGPEFATPLGIAVSSALNLISDSFTVLLNGARAKLFRSNSLSVLDVLLMNGWRHDQMIGRSGKSLIFELDGESRVVYGGHPILADVRLNGAEASLSATVRAGDSIVFKPAQNGADASMTLGEAVELHSPGSVFLQGTELPLGLRATVNGLPGEPNQPLCARDRIRTRPVETLEQLLSYAGVPQGIPYLVNDTAVPPGTPLRPGDRIEPLPPQNFPQQIDAAQNLESAPDQENPLLPDETAFPPSSSEMETHQTVPTPVIERNKAETPQTVAEASLKTDTQAILEPTVKANAAENPEGNTEAATESELETDAERGTPILLTLNGRPLLLEQKADRSPYCLIDMLNLVEIDLTTPQGAIVLHINGRDASYLEPLKSGDTVEIYWDGQPRS